MDDERKGRGDKRHLPQMHAHYRQMRSVICGTIAGWA